MGECSSMRNSIVSSYRRRELRRIASHHQFIVNHRREQSGRRSSTREFDDSLFRVAGREDNEAVFLLRGSSIILFWKVSWLLIIKNGQRHAGVRFPKFLGFESTHCTAHDSPVTATRRTRHIPGRANAEHNLDFWRVRGVFSLHVQPNSCAGKLSS